MKREHVSSFISHSSPMAVLMISALLNLAASSNLVIASLQDLFCEWKEIKIRISNGGKTPWSHRDTPNHVGVVRYDNRANIIKEEIRQKMHLHSFIHFILS